MLVVSLPLYVCATASIPIAAALVSGGIPVASALVFLIAGPATNFATIGAIYSQFGVRNTLTYLSTLTFGSIAGALVFDRIWGNQAIQASHLHEHLNEFSVIAGVALMGLFTWFAFSDTRTQLRKLRARHDIDSKQAKTRSLQVTGMNCQPCVSSIESALFQVPGVRHVFVDLQSGRVKIEGSVTPSAIYTAIAKAGFEVQSDDAGMEDIC